MTTPTWSWELAFAPTSISLARAHVRAAMADAPADAVDRATLLVSEVVANALAHGAAPVALSLAHDRSRWSFRVSDGAESLPVLKRPSPDAEGGRGMLLVASLASDWGVLSGTTGGKIVWFEVEGELRR